ncbi:MAG: hypothetical protein Q4G63_04575 [Bacteroidia bacterium]|nr:hypothetical protein [Bacteroidia bacterium]
MKTKILTLTLLLLSANLFSQINNEDSTVQVIAYWDLGEKQDYTVIKSKTKVVNGDTISIDSVRYDVELLVVDSTANSYTMQWIYKDVFSDNKNPFVVQTAKTVKGLKILYKTDEMGVFESVMNWEEINEYIQKQYDSFRDILKNYPEMVEIVNKTQAIFANKNVLESSGIKEIKQFHNFYGGAFKLDEIVEAQMETPTPFSEEPMNTDVSVVLNSIDSENDFYVMESRHSIDEEQLADVAFEAIKKIGEKIDMGSMPKKEDFIGLANETYIVSSIHNWGWIIYSELTTTITSGNTQSIEQCSIEMK